MEDNDWEKEYERERAALRAGGAAALGGRRKVADVDDSLAAQYYGSGGATSSSSASAASPFDSNSGAKPPPVQARTNEELFGSANPTSGPSSKAVAAGVASVTAGGGGGGASAAAFGGISNGVSTGLGGFPGDDDREDRRYGLPFDKLPPAHSALLRDKISAVGCFFIGDCYHYTKAFIGTSKHKGVVAVTSHGVTVFDAEDGSAVGGIAIVNIASLFVVGPGGVGLRSKTKTDYFIKFDTRREQFVSVLQTLYARVAAPERTGLEASYYGGGFGGGDDGPKIPVVEGSDEKEKTYRGEIEFVKAGKFVWQLRDDVRSGLDLVFVPPEHQRAYAPLCAAQAPKILHHFGGVNHLCMVANGTGKKAPIVYGPQRRGFWITPSAVFLSMPQGPGDAGQFIRRAVYIENARSVVISSAPNSTQLAIVLGAGGAQQPDLLLEFDTPAIRNRVVFVLRRIFHCRTHTPLFVRTVPDDLKAHVQLADETNLRPVFEPMYTVPQLLWHLQQPVKK